MLKCIESRQDTFSQLATQPVQFQFQRIGQLFFTKQLLAPHNFEWAKQFLLSQAWRIITAEEKINEVSFALPTKCPNCTLQASKCAHSSVEEEEDVPMAEVEEQLDCFGFISMSSKASIVEGEKDGDSQEDKTSPHKKPCFSQQQK